MVTILRQRLFTRVTLGTSRASGENFEMTKTLNPVPHPAFLAEIERNKAISLLVWKARQHHPFDQQMEEARRLATFDWTGDNFGIRDRTLFEFSELLSEPATHPDAEALAETARRRRVSLSELVAEQVDPARLPVLRIWYRLAGEAVRFEIWHGFSEGPRIRHLTTILAERDDNRAVTFETFGDRWRDRRHAVVLFTDVAPTGMDEFQHALPLNSLAAFLAQRAARVLTTPIFWKQAKAEPRLFPAPPILQDESGEGYFRRVAGMLREAGAVKVIIDEASFSLATSIR